ncbi:GIY-YIG nuclease family protein [Ancylobacter sp. Lp-2]|uniref:GIY-YIG nuclease family protein n=1 Tax=Ancylobacter sp. Lp-2 TaxID=2881339 RepID=UPI00351D8D36
MRGLPESLPSVLIHREHPHPGGRGGAGLEGWSSGSAHERRRLHAALRRQFLCGSTRGALEIRLAEHQSGTSPDYTYRRRPVTLIWSEHFPRIDDAVAAERQLKGWSRAKKEALARGDWTSLREAARRPSTRKE